MDLEFPKKKMTGNKDREFIVLRQNALQQFLNFIVTHRILRHSLALKHFLHPSLYAGDYQGRALIQYIFLNCYFGRAFTDVHPDRTFHIP